MRQLLDAGRRGTVEGPAHRQRGLLVVPGAGTGQLGRAGGCEGAGSPAPNLGEGGPGCTWTTGRMDRPRHRAGKCEPAAASFWSRTSGAGPRRPPLVLVPGAEVMLRPRGMLSRAILHPACAEARGVPRATRGPDRCCQPAGPHGPAPNTIVAHFSFGENPAAGTWELSGVQRPARGARRCGRWLTACCGGAGWRNPVTCRGLVEGAGLAAPGSPVGPCRPAPLGRSSSSRGRGGSRPAGWEGGPANMAAPRHPARPASLGPAPLVVRPPCSSR